MTCMCSFNLSFSTSLFWIWSCRRSCTILTDWENRFAFKALSFSLWSRHESSWIWVSFSSTFLLRFLFSLSLSLRSFHKQSGRGPACKKDHHSSKPEYCLSCLGSQGIANISHSIQRLYAMLSYFRSFLAWYNYIWIFCFGFSSLYIFSKT